MASSSLGAPDPVRQVASSWPGREAQIAALHAWLSGRAGSHLIVHGPPGSGKTGVIRHCLQAWGRRFAYVPMPQEYKLRSLLGAVLWQLGSAVGGPKRRREGAAAGGGGGGSESWADFAEAVAAVCPPSAPATCAIVLDGMQWGAHGPLLPQLMAALRSRRASVVVIAISSTPPQDLRFGAGVGACLPLCRAIAFPAYDREQLVEALALHVPTTCGCAPSSSSPAAPAPSPALYRAFLAAYVAAPLSPISRSAADLAAAAAWLWPHYSAPLADGRVRPDGCVEVLVRQLDGPMRQRDRLRRLLEAFRPGMRAPPPWLAADAAPGGGGGGGIADGGSGGGGGGGAGWCALAANLGKAAKLLLLAAFVASRNKPTLDAELFEFRRRPAGRRRGGAGRAGEAGQEADRAAEAAREARLKGPHAFPLSRLIAIFHRLWAAVPALDADPADAAAASAGGGGALHGGLYGCLYGNGAGSGGNDGGGVLDMDLATGFAGGRGGMEAVWSQSGAVLSSVTGLQSMGLIAQHGAADDPLDAPRYTCAIDEPLALRLAGDVGLPLHSYLMYDK